MSELSKEQVEKASKGLTKCRHCDNTYYGLAKYCIHCDTRYTKVKSGWMCNYCNCIFTHSPRIYSGCCSPECEGKQEWREDNRRLQQENEELRMLIESIQYSLDVNGFSKIAKWAKEELDKIGG